MPHPKSEGNYLWVGGSIGLARFDKQTEEFTWFTRYDTGLPLDSITAMAIDQNGIKWFAINKMRLVKYDDVNWTVYDIPNSGSPDNQIRTIAIDAQNEKWIGTSNGGIVVLNDTSWTT